MQEAQSSVSQSPKKRMKSALAGERDSVGKLNAPLLTHEKAVSEVHRGCCVRGRISERQKDFGPHLGERSGTHRFAPCASASCRSRSRCDL